MLVVEAGETVRPTFYMESMFKPKPPRKMIIMAQAGFGGGGQTSFGGMIGFTRTNGVYVAFRSDFSSVKTVGDVDDSQRVKEPHIEYIQKNDFCFCTIRLGSN